MLRGSWIHATIVFCITSLTNSSTKSDLHLSTFHDKTENKSMPAPSANFSDFELSLVDFSKVDEKGVSAQFSETEFGFSLLP